MTRLLLVSPGFHGHWRSIQRAFEALGYDVVTHCYDAAPRMEKVWRKVRYELPGRLAGRDDHLSTRVVTRRSIAALREARPDVVLVVRGDALEREFFDEARAGGARTGLWLYDQLSAMRFDRGTLGELGNVATFSANDATTLRAGGLDALHVPLAYDPAVRATHVPPQPEFTFIGAGTPKRTMLLEAMVEAGLPVRAYGRFWSDHPVDRLRTWRRRRVGLPNGRELPLEQAQGVMRASLATLNAHGAQDGFTLRTFEAAGVGAVQLIDREDVAQYYEPGHEVLVFSDAESLVRQAHDVMASPNRMAELRAAAAARTAAEHTFVHRARVLETLWA